MAHLHRLMHIEDSDSGNHNANFVTQIIYDYLFENTIMKIQAKSPKVCHSVGDIFIFLRVEENSGKQIVDINISPENYPHQIPACHTFQDKMSNEMGRKQTREKYLNIGCFKTTLMLTEK